MRPRTRSSTAAFDAEAEQIALQRLSIPDLQSSISANDAKSSAALIVHGLLFAGVVELVKPLATLADEANVVVRAAGGAIAIAAVVLFIFSVYSLIRALMPHDPDLRLGTGAFFPPTEDLKKRRCRSRSAAGLHSRQVKRVSQLTTRDAFRREYAAEQLKLQDIRAHQARCTKRGLKSLIGELGLVMLLFAVAAAVALHVSFVTHP